ncbi:MAG: RNA-binding protein [Candidatus Bilamarchaeaceae archaeon]
MKKVSLSKSDIKEINERIPFAYQLPVKSRVEMVTTEDRNIILLESKPVLFEYQNKIFPTLFLLTENNTLLKRITVDKGAIKFVANGADIMRPGVVFFDENIKEGDGVAVIEETYGKVLAVGLALFSTEEMRSLDKGKVVLNLHYVGDRIWNYKEGK